MTTRKPPQPVKIPRLFRIGPLAMAALPLFIWLGAYYQSTREDERVWVPVREPGLGFAAEFPRAFKEGERKVVRHETKRGEVPVHTFGQHTLAFFWGITVAEFPPGADEEPARDILQRAVDEQLAQYRATVDSTEPVEVNGVPALKVTGSLPRVSEGDEDGLLNHNRVHLLVAVRGNRLYRVSALGLGNEEMVAKFFDAFELLPEPEEEG